MERADDKNFNESEKTLRLRKDFLSFAKPSLDERELEEVAQVLQSGWLATGPKVKVFRQGLASYIGIDKENVFLVSSGTSALYMALKVMDLQPGDEVITTPLTFVATANAIVLAGGVPVFADIDPSTFNLDIKEVEKKITPKTKAILPVHYAGLPLDLDDLYRLAEKHNLVVIEDCAHAIGADYKGRKLGSFGHMQIFSFHPNKVMTTGEGGALLCHDRKYHDRLQALSFHGIDRSVYNRFSKEGSQVYDVLEPSLKHNMNDLQAAIGMQQLGKLDTFLQKRSALARVYYDALADREDIKLPDQPIYDHRHGWHLLLACIQSGSGMDRDEFMYRLKEYNIGTGLHYTPVHLFSYYQKAYGYGWGDFPHTEAVGASVCSLPLFPDMTESDVLYVVEVVKKILNKGKENS